jgi:hypothetical protein
VDKPRAKGKIRRDEIDAEAEVIAEFEKKMLKPVKAAASATRHRDEVPTNEVVSIMADELELIFQEFGGPIDRDNAEDKALTLWRQMFVHEGISARDKPVEHVLCEEHI